MELLWVIIIVAAIFFRIFGKLTDLKEKIPGEWKDKVPREWRDTGLPPVFREMGFPWDEEQEEDPAMVEEKAEPAGRNAAGAGAHTMAGEPRKLAEWQLDEIGEEVPAAAPEPPANVPQTAVAGQGQAGYNLPVMDKQVLLNGIIFSEVLQPPRYKRGRR